MRYDLIIIGSGPAGYVGAIRAGQTGLKTLVIDKRYVGGMCLNWGCIPSKTWLESARLYSRISRQAADFGIDGIDPAQITFNWAQAKKRSSAVVAKLTRGIEYLWKKNGVEFLKAEARILSPNQVEADNRVFETNHIMIATGSRPAQLDNVPHLIGLERFGELEQLPEKPIIWGHGPIAFEMLQFFRLLGRDPVLALTADILLPDLDPYIQAYVDKKLKKEKLRTIPANELVFQGGQAVYNGDPVEHDAVINCSWRKAVLPAMDIELRLEDGFIATDENYRSSEPNIFAAGDVNGRSYLAHAASAQAIGIVDFIHGKKPEEDAETFWPINIYSDPEIAQIGKTEPELKALGIEYKIAEDAGSPNGKALAEGASEGFLRLLYEPRYSQVLGVRIVAAYATDMIAEAAILMQMEGTVYDVAQAVHAHPTVAEVFMDAGSEAVHQLVE